MLLIAQTGPVIPSLESWRFVTHSPLRTRDRSLKSLFYVNQSVSSNHWQRIEISFGPRPHIRNSVPCLTTIRPVPRQNEMERAQLNGVQ